MGRPKKSAIDSTELKKQDKKKEKKTKAEKKTQKEDKKILLKEDKKEKKKHRSAQVFVPALQRAGSQKKRPRSYLQQ